MADEDICTKVYRKSLETFCGDMSADEVENMTLLGEPLSKIPEDLRLRLIAKLGLLAFLRPTRPKTEKPK